MTVEDIKSPLPARNIPEPENEPVEAARIETLDQVETNEPIDNPPSQPEEKPVKKNKKLFLFGGIGLGLIVILVLVFAVIIPRINASKKEIITINYWGLWEEPAIMGSLIAEFESKNPLIKVNYKMNQKNDYRTRLIGRLSKSGDETEVPDIFRIHNTWMPMFKSYLAPVPASTSKSLELDSDFFDTYKSSLKINNQFAAIPLMYDGLALFYNKELIESSQVSLPKSWWDLKSAANKLTVKDEEGKIKVAGVAMGLTDNVDHWSDILGLMMKQNGVDPLNTTPENLKKMEDVIKFYTIFRTQDKVWDESLPSSTQLFASGKLAFYFAPSWRVFNINDLNKDLKYEIITVPQLPTLDNVGSNETNTDAELTNIHWATYWVEGVNNKSKHQEEAWKFLEYLASREGLEKMYTAASQTREFGEIYPRKSMVGKINTISKINPYISVANDAESWYMASNTNDDGLNTEMQKYFADAVNGYILKSENNETIMETLKKGIEQVKTRYQLK